MGRAFGLLRSAGVEGDGALSDAKFDGRSLADGVELRDGVELSDGMELRDGSAWLDGVSPNPEAVSTIATPATVRQNIGTSVMDRRGGRMIALNAFPTDHRTIAGRYNRFLDRVGNRVDGWGDLSAVCGFGFYVVVVLAEDYRHEGARREGSSARRRAFPANAVDVG